MRKTVCAVSLFVGVLAVCGFSQTLWLSSYWDGCKPTCSWAQYIPADSEYGLSRSCDINDKELPLGEIAEADCYKDGGPAFTCWNQIPFVDPDNPLIAYGFGATNTARCGDCFEVTFTGEYEHGTPMPMHTALKSSTSGKKVILMARNTGGDVAPNQIDFMIPGGGLGMFNCFTPQLGPSYDINLLGKQGGGILGRCIDEAIPQFGGNWNAPGVLEWVQDCHKTGCQRAFGENPGHALLLEGCLFHADWMMSAPNPLATVTILDKCPPKLVDKYMPESSKYTIMKKAMYYSSKTGNGEVNQSNLTLSNINSTTVLTYNDINAQYAGLYSMKISLQTGGQTKVSVTVNGRPVGSVSLAAGEGSWSSYKLFDFADPISLNEGANTVVLTFDTHGVNVDYFVLTGDDDVIAQAIGDPVSVRPAPAVSNLAARHARSNVTLRAVAGGFAATLPANHAYTSYRVIDLQGREIKRGRISAGMNDLRFDNVKSGVVFLRLDGKNTSTVLRATALR